MKPPNMGFKTAPSESKQAHPHESLSGVLVAPTESLPPDFCATSHGLEPGLAQYVAGCRDADAQAIQAGTIHLTEFKLPISTSWAHGTHPLERVISSSKPVGDLRQTQLAESSGPPLHDVPCHISGEYAKLLRNFYRIWRGIARICLRLSDVSFFDTLVCQPTWEDSPNIPQFGKEI